MNWANAWLVGLERAADSLCLTCVQFSEWHKYQHWLMIYFIIYRTCFLERTSIIFLKKYGLERYKIIRNPQVRRKQRAEYGRMGKKPFNTTYRYCNVLELIVHAHTLSDIGSFTLFPLALLPHKVVEHLIASSCVGSFPSGPFVSQAARLLRVYSWNAQTGNTWNKIKGIKINMDASDTH